MELIKNRPDLENPPISSGDLINMIPNIYEVNNNCKDESKFVFDKLLGNGKKYIVNTFLVKQTNRIELDYEQAY